MYCYSLLNQRKNMENNSENQIIFGRNAVTEALRSDKAIDTVYIQKDLKIEGIAALAKERGAVVKIVGAEKIAPWPR